MGTNYYFRNDDGTEGKHLAKISSAGMGRMRVTWALDPQMVRDHIDRQLLLLDEYGNALPLWAFLDRVAHADEHDESCIGQEFS